MLRTVPRSRLTPKEAADFAAVSVWTIRRAIADGEISAIYINARVIRLERGELEGWIAARRRIGSRKATAG